MTRYFKGLKEMSLNNRYANFLVMNCGNSGFVINRSQITASFYIDSMDTEDDATSCCSGTVTYGNEAMKLFNLMEYLAQTFHINTEEEANLAVVVSLSEISQKTADSVRSDISDNSLLQDYLALRIANQSSIESLPLNSLRLLPDSLREHMKIRGLLGIRFTEESGIHYFVDLDTLLLDMLRENP